MTSIRTMMLGISIMLAAGIVAIDPEVTFGGLEYVFVFLGLVTSFLGFSKKDE
ncbi:hypothetical protein [Acetivibrio cellulolyticus]|uniref:hypothetical protein n=1 Tax=Acetivibrio cellulolyticus TaxID=35830 RepID=UPI0001E2D19D|nr:hypothetical protein [Acetivibrio cellulolyticus]